MEIIDATGNPAETFTIEKAPVLTHEEAQEAAATATYLQHKYQISDDDMNKLLNCMLAVFVRAEFCKHMGHEPGETKANG